MTKQKNATPSRRVALVTGGARRIGFAIGRRLHGEGYRVAIHHRESARDAEALVREMNRQRPDSAAGIRGDLRTAGGCEEITREAHAAWGRLDALVNNASAFRPTPLGATT